MLHAQSLALAIHKRLMGTDPKREKPVAAVPDQAQAIVDASAAFTTLVDIDSQIASLIRRRRELEATINIVQMSQRIEPILRLTAQYYKTSPHELKSKRRTKSVVIPRHVAMYLAKTLTERSYPEIGRVFGDRDHTTVMSAVEKIEGLRKTNAEVDAACKQLSEIILGFKSVNLSAV